MARTKLTKIVVEGVAPGARDAYVWDSQLTGFGLKVTPAGARVYLVQYRPKGSPRTRRYNLGRHGAPYTAEAARTAAAALLARVRLGEDPFDVDQRRRREEAASIAAEQLAAERQASDVFKAVVTEYIKKYAKPKNRTWSETERILTFPDLEEWTDRSIISITRQDVLLAVDRVSERSSSSARVLFAQLRKFFSWCVQRLYIETSPCAGLRGPSPAKARDRVLTDAELANVWQGLEQLGPPFAPLIKLLILTGQRREEVTGMRWSELDLVSGEWLIPAERTKNGQAHAVDLSELAIKVLDEVKRAPLAATESELVAAPASLVPYAPDLVFTTTGVTPLSGHSKIKARLDHWLAQDRAARGGADMAAWRLHDLRRTAATGMARLGANPHVVEAVLNHRSGVRGGLVAIYQHYDQRLERRNALQAWGAYVAAMVAAAAESV